MLYTVQLMILLRVQYRTLFVCCRTDKLSFAFLFSSAYLGVVGGLYLWGADLDMIVLVNLVMVVGLTVDFSAHISYHCFTSSASFNKPESFVDAIHAVAIPSTEVLFD